jgi:hypothetical protein
VMRLVLSDHDLPHPRPARVPRRANVADPERMTIAPCQATT